MLVTINWLQACHAYFGRTAVAKPYFFHDGVWRAFAVLRLQKATFRVQRLWAIRTFREERDSGAASVDWTIPHLCAQYSRASDPRDYIYGILGLTDLPIVPNYNKSIYEVYHEYIMKRVESTKCIDWFGFAGIGNFELESSEQNLPSWIPDYARHASLPSSTNLTRLADANIFDEAESAFEICSNTFFVHSIIGPRATQVQAQSFVEYSKELQISGRLLEFVIDPVQRFVTNGTGIHRLKAILDIMLVSDIQTNISYLKMAFSLIHLLGEIADSIERRQLYQEQLPRRESLPRMLEHRISIFMPHCSSGEIRGFQSQIEASRDEWRNTTVIRHMLVQLQLRYRFIELEGGYLGIGPLYTKATDSVCVVHGCGKLLLVREYENYYKLVGECFVLGLMGGEMQELIRTGMSSRRRIALV